VKKGYRKPTLLGCQGLAAQAGRTSLSDGFGGPDFIGGPHAVRQEYRNQVGGAGHEKVALVVLRSRTKIRPSCNGSFSREMTCSMIGRKSAYLSYSGVPELQYRHLDFEYLKAWIARLDLEALWERLISEAVIC
jgi:hypothetical protein